MTIKRSKTRKSKSTKKNTNRHMRRKNRAHKNRKHRGGIGVSGSAPNPCPHPGACNPTMLYNTIRGGGKNNALPYNAKSIPWGRQMAAFPPGPIYTPGANNMDAKFYGKLENPFLPDPASSNKALGGGRKTRRRRNKTKTNKKKKMKKQTSGTKRKHIKKRRATKHRSKKHRSKKHRSKKHRSKKHRSKKHIIRRRRRKGGNISQIFANNVPGFSDLRDLYWKAGEKTHDLYNTYKARPRVNNTSAGVQPIEKGMKVHKPSMMRIPANVKDGSDKASQFTPY